MKPREIAFKIVYDVMYNDKFSNIVLENYLNKSNLEIKDRSLVNKIVMGTLQNYLYLENILKNISDIAYSKISKSVRVIILISIYQLIYLDKIPDYAICDEGVSITSKYSGQRSKKFVNAILRKSILIKDDKDTFLELLNKKEYLSIKYSFNMNIINQLYKKYGFNKLEDILKGINDFNNTAIRVNTLKISKENLIKELEEEGFSIKETDITNCLYISNNSNPSHSTLYEKGYYTLMDLGAIQLVNKLRLKENINVLDACAAPGGKTTYISQLMNNTGKIEAYDIHASRVALLKKNIIRMGCNNVECYVNDISIEDKKLHKKYDRILLDVPCSGIGVSKKRPEIKLKYEYKKELIETQKSILESCSKYIKDNGYILYTTCTILPCENELIIDWFIKEYNFKIIEINNIIPSKDNMGFFYCLMERNND